LFLDRGSTPLASTNLNMSNISQNGQAGQKTDYQLFAEAAVAKFEADRLAGLHMKVLDDGTILVPNLVWNCQILSWAPL
jgi:hypothetical protein